VGLQLRLQVRARVWDKVRALRQMLLHDISHSSKKIQKKLQFIVQHSVVFKYLQDL